MNLYILRHGTTNWNEKGISQGRSQNRLSKNGIELVNNVAKQYKNIKIDIIYSSPLFRTIQTANIVNKYHNAKITKDNRLIEIDQGIFTGRKYSDLNEEELKLKLTHASSCKMESYKSVYERAKDFLNYILKNESHKNILVVSHNSICSCIDFILNNVQPDLTNNDKMNIFGNAELRVYNIKEKN